MKIVVFDLDETLGYFTQFGIFWDSLKKYLNSKEKQIEDNDFTNTLDLYPEFLRPNIINILNYLKKKMNGHCNKVLIYTNNIGPREWAEQIVSYFESKIEYKLFHQIIAAFKINGKRVEMGRTTQNKTHCDLIKCTKMPHDTEICYIDDVFYPEMANDNVYYINIKPYFYQLSFNEMVKRFISSPLASRTDIANETSDFFQFMTHNFNTYNYTVFKKNKKEYEIDKILGKHIIHHLQIFFGNTDKNNTFKNKSGKRNKTHKNHNE